MARVSYSATPLLRSLVHRPQGVILVLLVVILLYYVIIGIIIVVILLVVILLSMCELVSIMYQI